MSKITFFLNSTKLAGTQFPKLETSASAAGSIHQFLPSSSNPDLYARLQANTPNGSAGAFSTTQHPVAGALPDASYGDALATELTYTRAFATGTWSMNIQVAAGTNNSTGRLRFRVFKGPNATGLSASEITTAVIESADTLVTTATAQQGIVLKWNAPAFTLDNERLFFTTAWRTRITAGVNTGVQLRYGPSSTITTTDHQTTTVSAVSGSRILSGNVITFQQELSPNAGVSLRAGNTASLVNTLVLQPQSGVSLRAGNAASIAATEVLQPQSGVSQKHSVALGVGAAFNVLPAIRSTIGFLQDTTLFIGSEILATITSNVGASNHDGYAPTIPSDVVGGLWQQEPPLSQMSWGQNSLANTASWVENPVAH